MSLKSDEIGEKNGKNVISVIKNCIFASERFYHDFIALLLQNNNIKMNL